jgi:hypothetical protein
MAGRRVVAGDAHLRLKLWRLGPRVAGLRIHPATVRSLVVASQLLAVGTRNERRQQKHPRTKRSDDGQQ